MPSEKLSQLPSGAAIQDADLFYSDQSGSSVSQKASAIRTYALGNASFRRLLVADLNVYVSTTGNDSNSGMTAASPWLTIQHAFNYVMSQIDAANLYNIMINIAPGAYNTGGAALQLIGTVAAIGSGIASGLVGVSLTTNGFVTIDSNDFATFYVFFAQLRFGGTGTFTLTNQSSGGICLWADVGSIITQPSTVTLAFGAGASNVIHAFSDGAGTVNLEGPVSITGNFDSHLNADQLGIIGRFGATTTIIGNPTVGSAFAMSRANSNITFFAGQTFVGALTGKKYSALMNGTIESFGQTLPGTVAGTTATGGQYE